MSFRVEGEWSSSAQGREVGVRRGGTQEWDRGGWDSEGFLETALDAKPGAPVSLGRDEFKEDMGPWREQEVRVPCPL